VGLGYIQWIALSHELIMVRILYPFYINYLELMCGQKSG
jgi:hypothetical protein